MLTGRELIMFILENHLEDAPVFDDGNIIGFMTEGEAAAKFDVGIYTIRVWINEGKMTGIRLNDVVYIPANTKDPREAVENK